MQNASADRPPSGYELKDELARLSLSSNRRDPNQKLAWINSICFLFLLIGMIGARRGVIAIKPAPPLDEPVPVIVEPVTLPPQSTAVHRENEEVKNDLTPVAVVIPTAPNISFSVPTIGSLVVPANLAVAPPLEPMRVAPQIGSLNSTGNSGERPDPPYPVIAKQTGEQGTVGVLIHSDGTGTVVSVDLKKSSGYPILDRYTIDFIKKHWRLPTGGGQLFQTSITYILQF